MEPIIESQEILYQVDARIYHTAKMAAQESASG